MPHTLPDTLSISSWPLAGLSALASALLLVAMMLLLGAGRRRASERLEQRLAATVLGAAALALWVDLLGPSAALPRWGVAAMLLAAPATLITHHRQLPASPRRLIGGLGLSAGLLWLGSAWR
ncbi:hypothetical protein [Solimonas marina]|uniref:DUF3325 domain-containing protein n=1 Tax=Solimonas marina TaxID=2714601 RepID=A0A969WEC3_9GAMM|nr:hypothetical protein [Solimonas marina]NKF24679.1 hypothetical protein [Solimonas marina]